MTHDQLLVEAERYQLEGDEYWSRRVRRARVFGAVRRMIWLAGIAVALGAMVTGLAVIRELLDDRASAESLENPQPVAP